MRPGPRGEAARDALAVAAAALALYLAAGAGGYGFVNYDDDAVVQGNPVQSWGTLGSAFTERMAHAWLPLYALSLGLDNVLFGPGRPGAYHVHSILLHALNAVLVLLLARRLGMARGGALMAGLLFAVHPAVSESVAWVASRKDLLSFALAAASALVYLRAEEEPRRPGLHAAGAVLLGLGMLAKGTVVVVPALLLLAAWGLGRGRRAALATIPYFAVAGGLAAVHMAVAATEGTAGVSLGAGDTAGARAAAGLAAFGKYVLALVAPYPLSVEHDVGPGRVSGLPVMLGGLAALGLLGAAAFDLRRGGRARASGLALLAIVAALLPFNGVFPRTSVLYAERYLYVPAAVACGLLGSVLTRRVVAAVFLGTWAVLAFVQIPAWRDSLSLWGNAVEAAPRSPLARAKHGEALADAALLSRDPAERTALFARAAAEQGAAAANARSPLEEMRARHDAGVCLMGAGRYREAAEELARSMALTGPAGEALTPAFRASIGVNRAKALESAGDLEQALAVLEDVVRGDPLAAPAWTNLGVLRMMGKDLDGARTALLTATKADPAFIPARLALADLEEIGGDFAMALRVAVKAVEVSPRDTAALCKAGEVSFLLGQPVKAEEWYRKSLAVDGADPVALRGLAEVLAYRARVLLGEGNGPRARAVAEEATRTDAGSAEAWFSLGDVLRGTGDGTAALEAYHRAAKAGAGPRAADARATVYAAQAAAAAKKGRPAEARELLEKALAERPAEIRLAGRHAPVKEGIERIPPPPAGGEARGPLLDAVLALAAGEPAAAVEALGPAARDPGDLRPAALVFRSRARISADDLPGAVSDLETLVREAPGDARAHYLLGVTLVAQAARLRDTGRPDEAAASSARARSVLEQARALDPALAEAALALAEMCFAEDRVVDAIREVNAVLAKEPDRAEAHLVLGNIMKAQFVETRERTYKDQGEEHFRRVLATDPGEARALVGLGELAAFANKANDALAYARRALAVDADLPAARTLAATIYLRIGRARLEEGDAEGAMEAAKRADDLTGESAGLCLLRGEAWRKKGEWPKAVAEVSRALTLAPSDPEVKDGAAAFYRDLAYGYLLGKRPDQALEALHRAEKVGSDRVDLAEVRGLLAEPLAEEARKAADDGARLLKEGKAAEAAARFRESALAWDTAFARFGLGVALAAAGDGSGAEREYRRAADLDPSFADAWLNLGALLYRRGADAEAEEAYGKYLEHAPKEGAEATVVRVAALVEELRNRREKR